MEQEPTGESSGDLVSVGNLEIVKNHRFLVHVVAEATRLGRPLTLDVFGQGPTRPELLRLAQSLGVEEQVRLRGFQPNVRSMLPGYRAYVHACYSESFCFAVVEAMAAGLPVLTGDIGPLGELYQDGVEGRFWPLNDPAAAASLLIEMIDDERARSAAGQAARRRFLDQHDPRVVIPRLAAFLHGKDHAADDLSKGSDPVGLDVA